MWYGVVMCMLGMCIVSVVIVVFSVCDVYSVGDGGGVCGVR